MYNPRRAFDIAQLMGAEFGTEILEAILLVFLLSSTRLLTAASRILFATIAGVLAAISTNVSYWNWYGFPKRYTAAYMFIQIVGFFLVGAVAALMLKDRDPVRES
jgi:peptidoglycan/LPS O-acetylase OafA/YrhL